MSEKVHDFINPEGRAKIKVILVSYLRPIYDQRQAEYDRIKNCSNGQKESFSAHVTEQCHCDTRTIENLVSYGSKKLPTIYNLWMFYKVLKVPIEKQLMIQAAVTAFVAKYVDGLEDLNG